MSATDTTAALLARLDPTHPARWARVRARGRLVFVLWWGVLGAGVPLALLADLALDAGPGVHGTVQHAVVLAITLLAIAPLAGALVGNLLWTRGERRFERAAPIRTEMLDPATDDDRGETEPPGAGEAQRRLTELRASLERLSKDEPARLRRRVFLFAALGYGYIALVVLVLVACMVMLLRVDGPFARLATQGATFVGAFAFLVLSALRVRFEAPTGRRVTAAGSPRLLAAIERARASTGAPAPDDVAIDGELNASVTELPRWGIIGAPRRHLLLGLPLLDAFPVDEAEAIIAHELGHLSKRHGRRTAWLGRLAIAWQSLVLGLEAGRHWGRPLLLPFFRWYAPRLALHSQVLSRHGEHESDALAAGHAGAEVAARALLRLHVMQRHLTTRVLPAIRRDSVRFREPPRGGFRRLLAMLRDGPAPEEAARWVDATLAERTLAEHSHPSLGDRIASLGLDTLDERERLRLTGLLTRPETSAADALLGEHRAAKLREQLDEAWQLGQLESWRRWHADAEIWRAAGGAPDAAAHDAPLEILWVRARWAADCEAPDVAMPYVRAVVEREPSHLEAAAVLGRLLLESELEAERTEGARLLESIVRRDSTVALPACQALEEHYERLGWREEVERVQWRRRQLESTLLRSLHDRHSLTADDAVAPYALPAPMLETLRRACAAQRTVTRAYLVRKRTRFFRDQPLVVLAVECDVPWYKPADGAEAMAAGQALLDRLLLPESADTLAVVVPPRSALRRRLRALPGAECYRRDGASTSP